MINNEMDFFRWEAASLDTIDVKRCYVDAAGDLVAGILLSQIVFWNLPSNNRSKLRVFHDGCLWLAKARDAWWGECRITPKKYDRAINILEKKGFVATKVFKFGGTPTCHIRLNTECLMEKIKAILPDVKIQSFPKGNIDTPQTVNSFTETTVKEHTDTPTAESELFTLFNQNIQKITPAIKDKLSALIQNHGATAVLEATNEAVEHNVRNLAYITKILETWRQNGGQKPQNKTTCIIPRRICSSPQTLPTTEELVKGWEVRHDN